MASLDARRNRRSVYGRENRRNVSFEGGERLAAAVAELGRGKGTYRVWRKSDFDRIIDPEVPDPDLEAW